MTGPPTDARADAPRRGGWAYVSLLSVIPGSPTDDPRTVALQFAGFEAVAVVLAWWHGLWTALPAATVAIAIASAGSWLMVSLSRRVRGLPDDPSLATYRRYCLDSSVDVLMGIVAFVALVTVLLVDPAGTDPGLLARLFGEPLPVLPVAFGLVVAWDLCYRIGTAWWASLTGCWRSVAVGRTLDAETRARLVHVDMLVVAFAALQLLLVPVVRADPLLAAALMGHVAAVAVVSGASIALLRWPGRAPA